MYGLYKVDSILELMYTYTHFVRKFHTHTHKIKKNYYDQLTIHAIHSDYRQLMINSYTLKKIRGSGRGGNQ